eukprot:CAMPEP_0196148068 /NCGR_PEP_ID=MMETSP0910-20130528/26927_1 /TAXON_ID=49265 /ORGANISM="Thalassiosira rotula, Strain GSO102" /LENGTH=176 /DNA_ID=CAMNT_0041410671 /DNA_START=38 /DNA_END=565 /DNA_ORIENTATION=+
MKTRKVSPTAILALVNIVRIARVANAQNNCRSTTSTQSLNCKGIRCQPDYSGGCNAEYEILQSSVQRNCEEPDNLQESAVVCYYDDVCCPKNNVNDVAVGGASAAWGWGVNLDGNQGTNQEGASAALLENNEQDWWGETWSQSSSLQEQNEQRLKNNANGITRPNNIQQASSTSQN